MTKSLILQEKQIVSKIYLIRGQRVMIDVDLANLYGVPTKRLKEQVKRNLERFPSDFMFELTRKEFYNLDSYSIYDRNRDYVDLHLNTNLATQNASPSLQNIDNHENTRLRSHFATSNAQSADNQINALDVEQNKSGRGGSRILPVAFTEHGILMLSNVLSSPNATAASIEIIRVFVKTRELLLSNQELFTKVAELANKVGEHDQYIQTLYEYLKSFDEEQKRRIEWENRKPIGF
ncbi:MAG: ORF6N domain-containing protein [Bacteroidales bacterium]|nr:ORF6N domain-containing protein [Bacteroidales bacterium]